MKIPFLQTDYNGSADIMKELSDLSKGNKIPTKAALVLILQAQEHQIKKRCEMDTRIKRLEFSLFVYLLYQLALSDMSLLDMLDKINSMAFGF